MPQQPVVSSVAAFMVLLALLPPTRAETIRGTTVTASGQPLAGVMVSCFDEEHRRWTSVFSQSDGTYVIDGLRDTDHMVRARLMGWRDEYPGDTAAGESDLVIDLQVAAGEELEDQQLQIILRTMKSLTATLFNVTLIFRGIHRKILYKLTLMHLKIIALR